MSQLIDINDMLLFAKVAELKGITAAANALQIPKSKVSRRIANLERVLSVSLLERTTRSIKLTQIGRLYYQHCRRVREEAESATETINRSLAMPRGHLRVSVSVTMGQVLIAPYLHDFLQRYPEVSIDLSLENRRVDLIAEGFDLVIRIGALEDSSLVCKRIGTAKTILVAAPDYLLGAPKLDQPSDLRQHRTLVMSDSLQGKDWLLQGGNGRQCLVKVASSIAINDLTCIRQVAECGAGIALIPDYMAENSLAKGKLQQVLADWSSPRFNFYAIYPSHLGLSPKVEAWISFFREKFQAENLFA